MTMTEDQWREHPLGLPPSAPSPTSAREVINEMLDAGVLNDVMDRVDTGGLRLTGEGGFLPEMIKAVLERGLSVEQSEHLGYEKGDPAGRGSPNSRNGTTPKTLATEVGDVRLDVPRDRAGTFEPRLVPKGSRRAGGLDDMIISLYAGGMTVRDISSHLARTLGTGLSHDTISKVTDSVWEELKAWQSRPLEEIYPIIYLDALVVKVRDGHQVRNRAAHIAVGVDLDGTKHVLGIWVQAAEGAKFWAGVCAPAAQPRGARCAHRVRRGLDRVSRGHRGHLAGRHCADLHGAPNQGGDAVCVLRRPQACRRRAAPDLHRPDLEAAETELLAFAESPAGSPLPSRGRDVAERVGAVHPLPGVRTRAPKDHLHHELDRVTELPAPER
jgi:Transposase, Mutator family